MADRRASGQPIFIFFRNDSQGKGCAAFAQEFLFHVRNRIIEQV